MATDILIVSATQAELVPILQSFSDKAFINNRLNTYSHKGIQVDVLTTGVGMLATAYHLSKTLLHKKYKLIINAGIAGSFNKQLPLGTVVNITSEHISELGAQDGNDFLSIFSLNLLGENEFPFSDGMLKNPYQLDYTAIKNSEEAVGITVNTVHGEENSIIKLQNRIKADVESMEGGAFAYVCLQEKQRFLQLRAISNYVEHRNRAEWQIPIAIKNLNNTLLELLAELASSNE